MAPKIIDVKPIYQGWARYLLATLETPDGKTFKREIEDHGSAAAVLAYDPARRMAVLVQQFRASMMHAANERQSLEVVAGIVDENDPAETARREALEEAGLSLQHVELVAKAWSMPGISTERISLFLAEYSADQRTSAGGGLAEEHEDITVLELSLGELAAMADSGQLTDMKTLTLVQTLRLRRPDLFLPQAD